MRGHALEGNSLNLMSLVGISNKISAQKYFSPSKPSLILLSFVLCHLLSFGTCTVCKKTSVNAMIYVAERIDVVFTPHRIWLPLNNLARL